MSTSPATLDPVLSRELAAAARSGGGAPAVPVVERLLRGAAAASASDLHVEPEPGAWAIRFRIDGVLHAVARMERALAPTLVARLKVLADLPTYLVDQPQDGRIPAERGLAAGRGDLRLSIVPTVHGERAVVRLFDRPSAIPTLDELGLDPASAAALGRAVLAPQGVVVVCGPAGSGKSTTIHAALGFVLERSRGARSVVGIEDPVERVVPGVTQTQVDLGRGYGFAEALKALLRQDPEVIYLGEARDAATARVAIEAGLTGHLVITTLHAGSCAQVWARLLEMGIEPHLLTSALSATFAQRLLRRLCACASDDPGLEPALLARLGSGARPRRPIGCQACQGTGYRGRFPVVEHLPPGPALRAAVLRRADERELEEAAFGDRRSLLDHALARIAEGVTSREEVERVMGPL